MSEILSNILGTTIYKDLSQRLSPEHLALIEKAYQFAANAHEGQVRRSHSPYIEHCIEVVKILCDLRMDYETICAGFLHDVIEDTQINIDVIKKEFSLNILLLVESVTKISSLKFSTNRERQIETLRKMLLAMAKDIRVIIIKLADRLHNMRTLKHMPENRQVAIAKETLEVYAPLAHRLGMTRIKSELEDIAMYYLHSEDYKNISLMVNKKKIQRNELVTKTIDFLKFTLKKNNIPAEIQGRSKHFYSIYQKMKQQNLDFEQLYDLIAIRIVTETVSQCYEIMGLVHNIWKPVPGRFKDYIALPKPNMYQSIHTGVIGFDGEVTEIQIRTQQMHRVAEEGIAAHWKYKEGGELYDSSLDEKLKWLRQLTEWAKEVQDPDEFYNAVQKDIFSDIVFCFTPKGDVIELPAGSTALDFAFYIHSEIGNHCTGVMVNKKMVPLKYVLKNYDILNIITQKTGHPSADWLDIVKSGRARSKIRHWLKTQHLDYYVNLGKENLIRSLHANQIKLNPKELPEAFDEIILSTYNIKTFEDLCVEIGFGTISAKNIIHKYLQAKGIVVQTKKTKQISKTSSQGVMIENISDAMVRFSKCCNPLRGDAIVGFITRGRGVSIHRKDCPSLKHIITDDSTQEGRLVDSRWDSEKESYQLVDLKVEAHDRKSLLTDLSHVISKMNILIVGTSSASNATLAHFRFTIKIKDSDELSELMSRMNKVNNVISVSRSFRIPKSHILNK